MSGPPVPGLSSNFNEPPTDDTTSAPPVQTPAPAQPSTAKKKPFGAKVKNPGALAAAIARSKKARQGGDKWGS